MRDGILIGLDAGTSMVKAVAFDVEGNALGQAARPNRIGHVAGGGVEQDLPTTWATAAGVLRDLAGRLPALATRAAALAITGQGDGTWLIDAAGEPVAPAWLWLDGRSGDIVRELRAGDTGPALHRLTGTGLNPSIQSGQMLWLKRHRPELLARAATAFHCKDWLYFNCTGVRATDPAEGVFTYGDYRRRAYSDDVLELLGLDDCRRLLPEIVDGSREHAPLTEAAARATELPAGLPVVLAPVDILCTGLGGGMYEPGQNVGFTILGSTGIHMCAFHGLDAVRLGDQAGYIMPFVAPGTWAGMMSNMAATLNIDWLLDLAGGLLDEFGGQPVGRRALLTELDRRAAAVAPGTVLYHPFIFESGERGPFVNARARAQFLGLTAKTGFAELLRGVYDSLGLAARDCYEGLGYRPTEVRVGGGATRSATVRRILAGALDAPLRQVEQDEAGAAGAAMVACLSLGLDADVAAVCRRWVTPRFGALEQPDPELVAAYRGLLPVYRSGYRGMSGFWDQLAALRATSGR